MSASNHCRTGSESWSVATHLAEGAEEAQTCTQGVTAVATEGCDHDLATDALTVTATAPNPPPEVDSTVRVDTSSASRHHSHTSSDSWEELDPANLGTASAVTQNPAFASVAASAVSGAAEMVTESHVASDGTPAPQPPLCDGDPSSAILIATPAPASAAPLEVSEALPTPPQSGCATPVSEESGTHPGKSVLAEMTAPTCLLVTETHAVAPGEVDVPQAERPVTEEASAPPPEPRRSEDGDRRSPSSSSAVQAVPQSTVSMTDSPWPPHAAEQEEVDVSELTRQLMGDDSPLSHNEAPAPIDDEADASSVVSSAMSEGEEMSARATSALCSDMQEQMTVILDVDDTELPARAFPLPTGTTEVLRRRVVEEEFLAARCSSQAFTEEERRVLIEILFGDVEPGKISAEKFAEVMAPYRRQCECLGASFGIHHRGCRFQVGNPVAL